MKPLVVKNFNDSLYHVGLVFVTNKIGELAQGNGWLYYRKDERAAYTVGYGGLKDDGTIDLVTYVNWGFIWDEVKNSQDEDIKAYVLSNMLGDR